MPMLTDDPDAVIGVDTHTDSHTAAICDGRGAVLATVRVRADETGYGDLLDAVLARAPGPRITWAVEGTGSYGAGLTAALTRCGQRVVEAPRVTRIRGAAKNDTADAAGIARAALSGAGCAQPRRGKVRDALRLLTLTRAADVGTRTRLINQLKATVLTAPAPLRAKLRGLSGPAQITAAARLRRPRDADIHTATCAQVLRATATQILALTQAINTAERQLDDLTTRHAPALRAQFGVGPVSAAHILITWSHHGRFRDDAAFAAIAGTSPLEASSGKTTRHRLNRGGDRQLNAAIHRIALTRRTHHHPETIAYITRRTAEGKTHREINRCLKRALTRRLFRILNTMPALP